MIIRHPLDEHSLGVNFSIKLVILLELLWWLCLFDIPKQR